MDCVGSFLDKKTTDFFLTFTITKLSEKNLIENLIKRLVKIAMIKNLIFKIKSLVCFMLFN